MIAMKFSNNLIERYKLMKNRKVTKKLANMLYTLLGNVCDKMTTKIHDKLVEYYKEDIYNKIKDLPDKERRIYLNNINIDINKQSALAFAKFEIIGKINKERKASENVA